MKNPPTEDWITAINFNIKEGMACNVHLQRNNIESKKYFVCIYLAYQRKKLYIFIHFSFIILNVHLEYFLLILWPDYSCLFITEPASILSIFI